MNKKTAMLCVLGSFFISDVLAMEQNKVLLLQEKDMKNLNSSYCDVITGSNVDTINKTGTDMRKVDSRYVIVGRNLDTIDNTDATVDPTIFILTPMAMVDPSRIINKKRMFINEQSIELFLGTLMMLSQKVNERGAYAAHAIIVTLIENMRQYSLERTIVSSMSFSNFYKYIKGKAINDATKKGVNVSTFFPALDLKIKYTKFQKLGKSYEAVQLSPISIEDEKIFKINRMHYRIKKLIGLTSVCIGQ